MSKTTLFQRTEANIDLFEKELEHLNSCEKTNTSTIVDDKRRLDELLVLTNTLIADISKLRKAAQETDPALRTYGEQMASKVLAVCDRFDAVHPKLAEVSASITSAYGKYEQAEAAARAVQEREEAARAAAELAAKEALAKEQAAKAAAESARLAAEAAAAAAAAASAAAAKAQAEKQAEASKQ
eukprot:CAMPEP_0172176294 /NCGR_PEP_ID=MMETSP1050-20130122/14718_1 /TAXON_ID=233186 /ORGANISM="Cryptomonas curvata, Strain CCAP979/52" /LENGTH=183 /DNA_ID=CAMNT_0012848521 /DNA_START=10 /DNA_END=558 /DNA_ORIENTATION=+